LQRVEASDGRDELLTADFAVSVDVYQIYPFLDLVWGLFWKKFFESFFKLEGSNSFLSVNVAYLEYFDGIDLPISEKHAQFLDSLFELLILELALVLHFEVLHRFDGSLVFDEPGEGGVPHLEQHHALVAIEARFLQFCVDVGKGDGVQHLADHVLNLPVFFLEQGQ